MAFKARFLNEHWRNLFQRVGFAIELNVVDASDFGANVRHFGPSGLRVLNLGIDFEGVFVRFFHDESGRQQGFDDVVKINFGGGCNVFQISGSKPHLEFKCAAVSAQHPA